MGLGERGISGKLVREKAYWCGENSDFFGGGTHQQVHLKLMASPSPSAGVGWGAFTLPTRPVGGGGVTS